MPNNSIFPGKYSVNAINKAEELARSKAMDKIKKCKEGAKEEYKNIIVNSDNERRDIVESGKNNLPKSEKLIKDNFVGLFQ